jgi:two-component system phosphate regulon sensor histidine kinase PhoR
VTLSVRARLFLAHLVVVALALVAVILFAAREERSWVVRHSAEVLEHSARQSLEQLVAMRPSDLQVAAARLSATTGYRVTLIDSTGRVVADSDVPRERLASLENHAGRPEVRRALAGAVGQGERRSASIGRDLLYVAIPAAGLPGVAVVRLAEPLTEVMRLTASLIWVLVPVALAILVGMAGIVSWVTGRQAERVTALETLATRLGAGERGVRARELPGDEIGRLGRAINLMSSELESRLGEIERERDEREQILAHMSDGVALVDAAGHLVHANHSMAELLGSVWPTSGSLSFREFARSHELEGLLADARREVHPVEIDLRLWTPKQRFVRATATRLSERPDQAVLLVLHDLTEVERLDRVRQDFVANVSHELKTPLTSVRGYAETLLEGGLVDVEHREEFVRIIRDQATRLQDLVEDLLALAELERPDVRLKLETIDLREVARRQAAHFERRAAVAGLGLGVEEGAPVAVRADRERMVQVFANLLDNALKYTERGRIDVAFGREADEVWCQVRDTGSGIPEADLPRIFERFYRVDKARSRDKGGTGLGLSIVKHILALHGGAISVRSEIGKGTTFRFDLPQAEAE